MTESIAIAIGGALGALSRFWLGRAADAWFGTAFPWGILLVNVLGSFLIGIAFVLMVERSGLSPVWRAITMTGFLGAFTTFSTFSLQTLALIQEDRFLAAAGYVIASVVVCVAAAWGGMMIARLPG